MRNRLSTIILVLVLALTFAPGAAPAAEDAPAAKDTPAAEDAYALNPGDVLEVSVWKEEGMQRDVLVLPDGRISFPLAGHIQAAGKSAEQVAEQAAYRRAHRRMRAVQAFYSHLMSYIAVNLLLFFIDIFSGDGIWFFWPVLGWGAAVALHATVIFHWLPFFTRDWEQTKIREIIEQERRDDARAGRHGAAQ